MREACCRYLYYGVKYDIIIYFGYEYYMGGFLAELDMDNGKYCRNLPWIYVHRLIGEICGRVKIEEK